MYVDLAAIIFDDSLTNSQAHSDTFGIDVFSVLKFAKKSEELLLGLLLDTSTLISNVDMKHL